MASSFSPFLLSLSLSAPYASFIFTFFHLDCYCCFSLPFRGGIATETVVAGLLLQLLLLVVGVVLVVLVGIAAVALLLALLGLGEGRILLNKPTIRRQGGVVGARESATLHGH